MLIEDLRKGQTGPVHMLDQISRSLPPMLWLTEVKQVGADVLIDGLSTTQTGVSDFVDNLEASGYFKRSIDIVGTTTRAAPAATRRAGQVHAQGAVSAARGNGAGRSRPRRRRGGRNKAAGPRPRYGG